MSAISHISSNMQYLLQQATQVSQAAAQQAQANQGSADATTANFAQTLNKAGKTVPAAASSDPLANISMASLLGGSASSSSITGSTSASLLNILV